LIHSFPLFPFSSFINRYCSILLYFYFFSSPLTGFIRLCLLVWYHYFPFQPKALEWKVLGRWDWALAFFSLFLSFRFHFPRSTIHQSTKPISSQRGELWHDMVWIYVCTLTAPSFQSLVTAFYRIVMSLILHLFSLDSLEDLLTWPNRSFPFFIPTSLPQQPLSSVRKTLNLNHGTDDRLDPSIRFWIHFSRQISN